MLMWRLSQNKEEVKEENVLKSRCLSREKPAAGRRGTHKREVLPVTEGQPGQQTLMSFPAQELQLCKLGRSSHSQLPSSPYEFCGHTATLSLGIWMSA